VAQPSALGRPLDEAWDVGEHEVVIPRPDDTQVRLEGREGIVGDFRTGRADGRDERRLARVREAHEGGVGHETEVEAEPLLLAVLALLGEARRPARVRQEAGVAAPTAPATPPDAPAP